MWSTLLCCDILFHHLKRPLVISVPLFSGTEGEIPVLSVNITFAVGFEGLSGLLCYGPRSKQRGCELLSHSCSKLPARSKDLALLKNSLPVKRRSTLNLASWRYLLMYHITNTLSPVLCAHLLISWPIWFGTFWMPDTVEEGPNTWTGRGMEHCCIPRPAILDKRSGTLICLTH